MNVAVAGASGFVGRRLVTRLVEDGHGVRALGRRAGTLPPAPAVQPIVVDLEDRAALVGALTGCEAAYYLVHSLAEGSDFAGRDRRLAEAFGEAASEAGVGRIVYLGGLGEGDLSDHLSSRQEVGACRGGAGVPVVELRAAVILGSGSASFEMLRYLTERLPAMVCPRWIRTEVQPIGESDLLDHHLIGSLTNPVVVRDPEPARAPFDGAGQGVADAIEPALARQAEEMPSLLFDLAAGTTDGIEAMRSGVAVEPAHLAGARRDLHKGGGDLAWYGWAWRLRIWLGRPFGERLALRRPEPMEAGSRLDWWTVEQLSPGCLVLNTRDWFTGEAWLGNRVVTEPSPAVEQVGALRPFGLRGVVYWKLLEPVHRLVSR
jgi:uncharacterized protein YbjT (DUF2867 family)